LITETDGIVVEGEVGSVEDEESGGGDDIDGNLKGSGELAGREVRSELEIVALRSREFGESSLALELINALFFCHFFNLSLSLSLSESEQSQRISKYGTRERSFSSFYRSEAGEKSLIL